MSATPRHAAVNPAAEASFRRAYRRGWLAAVNAFAQLCGDRQLPPDSAAKILEEHHAQALERWEHDPVGIALYPPKVAMRRVQADG